MIVRFPDYRTVEYNLPYLCFSQLIDRYHYFIWYQY